MARTAKPEDIEIERGSGNVFADLGLPGAGDHMVKAELVARIAAIVKRRRLTQSQAGKAIGLKQPDVSKMLRGEFRGFSVGRLLGCLVALGHDVEIVVKPRARGKRRARMTVTAA